MRRRTHKAALWLALATSLAMAIAAGADPMSPSQAVHPDGPGGGSTPSVQSTLLYSPWVKVCRPAPDRTCFIVANGRAKSGQIVVSVMLVEPGDNPDRFLRITLPLAMQLAAGTRLGIDKTAPRTAPFVLCDVGGCMSDYAADAALMAQLKSGKYLTAQAVNREGQTLTFVVPLTDFAFAYGAAPISSELFSQQQEDLETRMRSQADEGAKAR
jgi:invasion protein IalB